jgi:hypothetical protein
LIQTNHGNVAVMRSSMRFPPVSVGDRFDDEGWSRIDSADPPGTREQPRRYVIHSVKHIITEESEHLVERYCLNLTPHGSSRSPVWDESDPVG